MNLPSDNKTMTFPSLLTPLSQTNRPLNIYPQPTNPELHLKTPPYKCTDCHKIFKMKNNFKKHARIHTGEKPFICQVCERRFNQNGNLNEHLKTHTGVKEFECKDCNKCFTNKGNLTVHIRSIHLKLKPFECQACKRRFNRNEHLNVHLKTHTGVKEFACKDCNKCFTNKGSLIRHIQGIHLKLKPFECDICKGKFTRKQNMLEHRKTHEKLNNMSCTQNENIFSKKGNIKTPMQHRKENVLPKKHYNQNTSIIGAEVNTPSTIQSSYSMKPVSKIVPEDGHVVTSVTGLNVHNSGDTHDDSKLSPISVIPVITAVSGINNQNPDYHLTSSSFNPAQLLNPYQIQECNGIYYYISNCSNSNHLNDTAPVSQLHFFNESANDIITAIPSSALDNEYETNVLVCNSIPFYSASSIPIQNPFIWFY